MEHDGRLGVQDVGLREDPAAAGPETPEDLGERPVEIEVVQAELPYAASKDDAA